MTTNRHHCFLVTYFLLTFSGLSWGIENNKMHSTTTDIPSEVLTTLSVIADEAHHVNVVKANKHWSGMYKKLKAYEQKVKYHFVLLLHNIVSALPLLCTYHYNFFSFSTDIATLER